MPSIPPETLHQGRSIRVLRIHGPGGTSKVVKQLLQSQQATVLRAKLRYEFGLLQQLERAGAAHVVRPLGLHEADGTLEIELGDIGGASLASAVAQRDMWDTVRVLHVAREVVHALAAVHRAGMIHKDINPSNIVYNPNSGEVQLIDFGIATCLQREVQPIVAAPSIEGTLAYASPEQTGRVQRSVDYRSDFYSLGATLYELLCGQRPFAQPEPAALLHAVLTQEPRGLPGLAPACHHALAAVVQKLLAKDAAERYQSAQGLLTDLERCGAGDTHSFILGEHDRAEQFHVPEKLYGRAPEVQLLQEAYRGLAAPARQIVVLRSPSGMGKSVLMRELQVLHPDVAFAMGRHDPLQRQLPFSALRQAVAILVKRILTQHQNALQASLERVQAAVGDAGHCVAEAVPALELLLGKQRPAEPRSEQDTERRLLGALQACVAALVHRRPTVLFLDNLQWADAGTLKLLTQLAGIQHAQLPLMLVLAYREAPEDAHASLLALIEQVQTQPATHVVQVQPLSAEAIADMVVDATRAPHAHGIDLGTLLQQRTGGNAFVVRDTLQLFWEKGLLHYDEGTGGWHWRMEDARAAIATASQRSVAHLALLRDADKQVLGAAACIGSEFSLAQLVAVCAPLDMDADGVVRSLEASLRRGLVLPSSGLYRYASEPTLHGEINYRFSHDRVAEAAYGEVAPAMLPRLHQVLGQRLLADGDRRDPHWTFAVAHHLNLAPPPQDATQAAELAQLNNHAAEQAMRLGSPDLAWNYRERAIKVREQCP